MPDWNRAIREDDSILRFEVSRPYAFSFHWLREIAFGTMDGDMGLRVLPPSAAIAEISVPKDSAPIVHVRVDAPPSGQLDDLARAILGAHDGQTHNGAEPFFAEEALPGVLRLRDEIYRKAVDALDLRLATQPATLSRRVVSGEFDPESSGECIGIELHMPFLDRKEWPRRADALANLSVECDGSGRLLVRRTGGLGTAVQDNIYQSTLALASGLHLARTHQPSSFSLSYTNRTTLPVSTAAVQLGGLLRAYGFDSCAGEWFDQLAAENAGGEVETSLAVSLPGDFTSAWLEAPGENSEDYFRTYARVSRAIQRAMRRWLPFLYFRNLDHFEATRAAFALLVYQSSRVFEGRPKHEFAYDVIGSEWKRTIFRRMCTSLRDELSRVQRVLTAAGRTGTAKPYAPRRSADILASAAKSPRLLASLLAADAYLADAFVTFGCRAGELRAAMADSPRQALSRLEEATGALFKTLHAKLRWLYGEDCQQLGTMLFIEATNALRADAVETSAIRSILHVTAETPHPAGQVFVSGSRTPGNVPEICE